MRSHIDMRGWEALRAVARQASAISRHVDFFKWLQGEVSVLLPHDVLVAVWGDFATGHLSYDVASNIADIGTCQVMSGDDAGPLMRELHRRWLAGGERWYVLEDFESVGTGRTVNSSIAALGRMRSALVHGIHDRRGGSDCIYVFFDKDIVIDVEPAILEILVPQIDAVLRRVECLVPDIRTDGDPGPCEISGREHEIMQWVRSGKTNHEIGLILNISPNTVKNHLKRIFHKLNVSSRAQAVAKYGSLARG
ncbi:XrtB/PEP-CTERM-associated transcriptional regulator EpsA [Parasulfuritortus cantonensis]|nr:XrtB/PEP-CTERM-associated transcriptional regulator EpsA [Parasulfuritortus cantonensis]